MNRIDPDGKDWRVQTRYNRETKKMEYTITVNAVLYNNSSDREMDMNKTADAFKQQVEQTYNTSGEDYAVKMDFNLKVVNSLEEVGDRDHIISIVDQKGLSKSSKGGHVRGETTSDLSFKIGLTTAYDILNEKDNRTVAHELGHTGGLKHIIPGGDIHNLMMQKIDIQKERGNSMDARGLSHSQIKTIRDNYIHNKLNIGTFGALNNLLK